MVVAVVGGSGRFWAQADRRYGPMGGEVVGLGKRLASGDGGGGGGLESCRRLMAHKHGPVGSWSRGGSESRAPGGGSLYVHTK